MTSTAPPLIPERYLDFPTQRLYFLSLGLLCQAVKLFDALQYNFSPQDASSASYCRKWLLVDTLYFMALSQLRIPRLNYSRAVTALQILTAGFLDGVLFGGINVNVAGGRQQLPTTPTTYTFSDLVSTLSLGLISWGSQYDSHLLGQHTVRMSPISTARLNPDGQMFCLDGPGHIAFVPVLLNNTSPIALQYSLTPLGVPFETLEKVPSYNLTVKDLNTMERKYREDSAARAAVPRKENYDSDDYDEYDDAEDDESGQLLKSRLQRTQSLVHIAIDKPGVVRLHRVLDQAKVDARVLYAPEVVVAPCPRVEFTDDIISRRGSDIRCAGEDRDINFEIGLYGVPPLSLRWYRDVNGKREHFMVEGIEGGHNDDAPQARGDPRHKRTTDSPQELKVPLTASLDSLGTHVYVLESVADGVGNLIQTSSQALVSQQGRKGSVGPDSRVSAAPALNTKTTRVVQVLQRPAVSFMHCGPGRPASLLIGSEFPLTVSAKEADAADSPWEIKMKYLPSPVEESGQGGRRNKPWTRTLRTQDDRKDLTFQANAPGEYSIVSVKGKYCDGDILSPDICKVVELPRPSADIEWRRIHECSGDTGVAASLILHGTPPFQVYYRMQRDKEPPRDMHTAFYGSRGELTLQPDRSGHYVFSFLQLSDANYKRIDLKGPSIDQVVHPLSSADFVQNGQPGRGKTIINTCSGDTVDVDVELRGTGPWNLDVQVVSPRGTETIKVTDIRESRRTIRVPIPKAIDKEGGSFEIDLASIEDKYKCKRTLSVQGVSVNVRRVKPVARFYGKQGKRNITVLENETAHLPLRLTGDGPWRLKYRRREEPQNLMTATLKNPNDQLNVTNRGLYELLEVVDSQCPGTVVEEEATYRVDWIPRPFARLAPETEAVYEPYNNSYILPSVCEGIDDHVDLDLIGRPPFQLTYNVAKNSETGAMTLLEQPTFSSIQHRTRFQLRTGIAGRMYYEVKQIGDTAYPLSKNMHVAIPRAQRLLFEQEVMMRPLAQFQSSSRMTYCLYDSFVPHDEFSTDGFIILDGTPPFHVKLSIKNLAASETHTETVDLTERSWKINFPTYTFKSIGPHLVTIESVSDANRCEQAVVEPSLRSIWVDVAESAAIIPFDRREYFCVGETSRFTLEGTPPWTIGYRVNGKSYTQDARVSPFSIIQQQPGEFSITSVAHQNKMCKTTVSDLRYTVHPLPSAQVGHGKRIFQDIHEGDQAEILFTLVGEPPFTFTYQRAEPPAKKGGKPGKVLETHTVSGVTSKEYSVFSALEGTWTVTFISDKYCRYPPAQVDKTVEKVGR
ncbi:hypothetical protein GLOTRDRAFT_102151 [Gloeophyllum trabeum ATCC 11539]|uniref:Ig-like domain-containing protein n=1 Tax=Gloeophyllum trabeum (strain ATCC 11539 / FP-39264 / Madison 617) TaxID=670483 RepID=S7QPF9_GLOTA|nr:uncharacterized protein GLOTRDRAFT_102151 [Gloeophyllum trabeum ATCC 11539]EPQ61413.1 hypothetical protein GLOTRDRAFT_102151 [Gloeophyllum trabeum ATCC 11539]